MLELNHDIFELFLIFKSELFYNETVDGIKDAIDILRLLLVLYNFHCFGDYANTR